MTTPLAVAGTSNSAEGAPAGPSAANADPAAFENALRTQDPETGQSVAGIFGADPLDPQEIRFAVAGSIADDARVTVADVRGPADPETRERIASLRNRITDLGGLNQEIVQAVRADPHISFNNVLAPGLYAATSRIDLPYDNDLGTGLAAHRHFIDVPADGSAAQIINAGPSRDETADGVDRSTLNVEVSSLDAFFEKFRVGDRPDQKGSLFRANAGSDVDLDARWGTMQQIGREIDAAELNYNFREQNSNIAAATIADGADLNIGDLCPAPVGWSNNLRDELQSRPQPPSAAVPSSEPPSPRSRAMPVTPH